jgi:hypothetical protein
MDAAVHALATSGLARWDRMPVSAAPSRWITVIDMNVRRLNVVVAMVGK